MPKRSKQNKQNKRNIILILGIISILLVTGIFFLGEMPMQRGPSIAEAQKPKVTIMKPIGCSCCGQYAQYLKQQGFPVETVELYTVHRIRQKYRIPDEMHSCHTAIVGEYFVEGHVPVEAIEKLIKEKPAIRGIALPEMPAGSPGMPGPKRDPFHIYAIEQDGTISEFMAQ